ncbi:MAG: amidase family protein, partial [Pseudomonadota bacterium]
MTDALGYMSIAESRARLRAGDLTSRALTEACLAAIASAAKLNAFSTVTEERALAMADAADAKRQAGEDAALLGIPLGIKDLFCTEGVSSQAASNILTGFLPPYESTVTTNLWQAGAVMLGKTNMDEFAMGSSNETSAYGPCLSPWQRAGDATPLTPGGSSGGSSSAVAAGLCLGATGTDTGGSIRQPAALTGIVGMKPTYGRCSRWGIVAFASSLDQAGPMARSVRDTAILMGAMAGHDPKDSTSADLPVPDYEAALEGGLQAKRIGIPVEYREGVGPEMAALWTRGIEMLREAGAEIVEISLPHTKYALPA